MNRFSRLFMAAVLAALPFQIVQAQAKTQSSARDARIQTAVYRSDDVFPVYTKVGVASMIELEADERFTGDNALVGMGDTGAWNLAVKGRNIIFKPKAPQPETNLILATNKRTYAFRLKTATARQMPTYILRFRYPDTEAAHAKAGEDKQRLILQAASSGKPILPGKDANRNYWARGDKALAPTAAWDNGRFTYFQFDNGREQPAVYKVLADNSEMLLNSHMEGGTLVVHGTAQNFVFRLGKSVLGVENRSYDAAGRYNQTKTDGAKTVRISKGAEK